MQPFRRNGSYYNKVLVRKTCSKLLHGSPRQDTEKCN